MKTKQYLHTLAASTIGVALLGTSSLFAEEGHHDHGDHKEHAEHKDGEKAKAGPNGGKIIHSVEPHLEFFVTEDKKIQFTAIDDHGKAIPIADQSISITGGSRANPTRLSFAKQGDVLISDKAFPEGKRLPLVIQIKATPESKTVIERFNLDLSECPTCDYLEYACICGHGAAGHDNHKDHKDHKGHKH